MAQIATFDPGTFCWTELETTDTEGAKAFYTALFDWTAEDIPAGENMVYTMLGKNGSSVAGLYEMPGETRERQVPTHWNSYIAADDVDAVTAKAESLGATVLAAPFDVMDFGRMSVIQDPEGAVFSLWHSKSSEGTTLKDEPGSLCWNELYVNDPEIAAAFYEALFGWTHTVEPGGNGQPYYLFKLGDEMVAGMMKIQPDWEGMPPLWGIYFAVDDCDAALEKAETLGGTSAMEPMDIEGVGRIGTVSDPQGGMFMILQFAAPC